jgi:universal stress protein A
MMDDRAIVYCTDFSESSRAAGQYAMDLAKAFGVPLILVHVLDAWAGFPAYEDSVPGELQNVVRAMEEEAKLKLKSLEKEFQKEMDNVTTQCRTGVPAEEIVAAADEGSAQLIVMGTHGWTGVKHLLLGSVAEKVLRMANCPVLVVRSPP